ncbi:MAG TPA: porin [Alphaproteobacteria bacterium]|nr:porin [Alphaproteobacteria bacterium]
MKKLLLGSAAIAGLVLASAPAQAQMELTIGGHSKNYVGYNNQDDTTGGETRNVDMQRETELHFNGESTLDNGLTFGFQIETEMDAGDDGTTVEESYIYMSGTWGRVNAGSENGASYLLQVSAPSADSNIDGIRQYINPANYATMGDGATALNALTFGTGSWAGGVPAGQTDSDGFDYDNDLTGVSEKLTYLSPNWNGFQVGASYTFDVGDTNSVNPITTGAFGADDAAGVMGDAWEVAARYEGVMSNFGYALGAGYTHVNVERETAAQDDVSEWNVGLDVDSGPFGIGAIYTEGDDGSASRSDVDTWVVGVDYTTGPFKFGASYFTQDDETVGVNDLETDRWTGGVVYTAGPGLSFRGSISNIDHEVGAVDANATSVMGGVQINF